MIQPGDIKAGNWISLKYPGSLVAAHRVLEVSNFGVFIEKGKTNTLIKVGETWEYPEVQQNQLINFSGIKGIRLTPEILEGCGFKLNCQTTVARQPGTEDSTTKYYSDEYLFTLNYRQGAPGTFTHVSHTSNIEFVHQLQNIYENYMNRELEISIKPFNFQLLS